MGSRVQIRLLHICTHFYTSLALMIGVTAYELPTRSAEPDIQFVVQIEADVGRSETVSNISFDLHNKSNVRRGSVQQMFYYA